MAVAPETRIASGPAGLLAVAAESGADVVVAGTDGAVAFDAVFAAVESGVQIAVANEELIVAAGELFMAVAARAGAEIIPVDSEHSAIFQWSYKCSIFIVASAKLRKILACRQSCLKKSLASAAY